MTIYPETLWSIRKITESSGELLALLNHNEYYTHFVERFKLESRKQEWLSVRVLLKELLGEEKEILYNEHGKPYIEDNSYQISISHTSGYVAVIANPTHKVGIDIERIAPRIYKIRSRFMSAEEESNLSPTDELTHLLLHWSAKETLFKILDNQNVDFQKHLHIGKFDPQYDNLYNFMATETRTPENLKFFVSYIANSEYVLTFTEL